MTCGKKERKNSFKFVCLLFLLCFCSLFYLSGEKAPKLAHVLFKQRNERTNEKLWLPYLVFFLLATTLYILSPSAILKVPNWTIYFTRRQLVIIVMKSIKETCAVLFSEKKMRKIIFLLNKCLHIYISRCMTIKISPLETCFSFHKAFCKWFSKNKIDSELLRWKDKLNGKKSSHRVFPSVRFNAAFEKKPIFIMYAQVLFISKTAVLKYINT